MPLMSGCPLSFIQPAWPDPRCREFPVLSPHQLSRVLRFTCLLLQFYFLPFLFGAATELVHQLHGLQHYDVNLDKAGNTFVYSTTDFTYPENLAASFALPWILFGIIAVITAIVSGGCDRRQANQHRYLQLHGRRASLACPTVRAVVSHVRGGDAPHVPVPSTLAGGWKPLN